MDKFVIKRNGQYLPFEAFKIEEAIQKAFSKFRFNDEIYTYVKSKNEDGIYSQKKTEVRNGFYSFLNAQFFLGF